MWIDNLARPDIPLLVLYAISQFASMRLSSTPPADDQQRQMQMMMLFFPLVMPFFLLAWPSAFTMYWMAFNILSMFFQFRMMKKADPTKNLIDQLIKQPLIPKITVPDGAAGAAAIAGAVPPRPKNGSGPAKIREDAVKTLSPGGDNAKGGRSRNGGSTYVEGAGEANGGGTNGNGKSGEAGAFTSSTLNGNPNVNGSANGSATVARKKRKKR